MTKIIKKYKKGSIKKEEINIVMLCDLTFDGGWLHLSGTES